MRYWSFNLGNSDSYTFNALKDEDALVDSAGIVTIVLGDDDVAVSTLCNQRGYNFMEWNMVWDRGLILFRHMLANPDFEAQIDDVPDISFGEEDFTPLEAKNFIGAYAPQGYRMDKASFLAQF